MAPVIDLTLPLTSDNMCVQIEPAQNDGSNSATLSLIKPKVASAAMPLKVADGDGVPVRAIAVEEGRVILRTVSQDDLERI